MSSVPSDLGAIILFTPSIRVCRERFGVCFLEAPESRSETMETSLKRKKIKELFSKSFDSCDLRYGADENPSLSAIKHLIINNLTGYKYICVTQNGVSKPPNGSQIRDLL